ncbi:hypothetical protein KPH14_005733 [Odynerus spinipes]|uniref:Uncharacterized protein n=1 Tax=Odynerus spinipes TaxID=1348599 RepID=A0AAD9RB30_9HYME|nr:hypothetical protein KPH14_005733 [Odynerus spinipes]
MAYNRSSITSKRKKEYTAEVSKIVASETRIQERRSIQLTQSTLREWERSHLCLENGTKNEIQIQFKSRYENFS